MWISHCGTERSLCHVSALPTFVSGPSLLLMKLLHGNAKLRAISRGTEKETVLLFLTCMCSVDEYFKKVIVQWLFQKSLTRILMALG